jgi:hypothetical protein
LIVAAGAVSFVCIPDAASEEVTVTVAVTSETSRLMFSTEVSPARTVIVFMAVLKPSTDASSVYAPGNRFVN